jgi:hypothetical protein
MAIDGAQELNMAELRSARYTGTWTMTGNNTLSKSS